MISNKLLAVLVVALVACGAGVGAVILNQGNQASPVNADYVAAPTSSPNDLNNATINAVNSTIIAGEGSTIINPSASPTASPTETPTPTPTPVKATIVYWHEVSRTNNSVTLRLTANGVFEPGFICVNSPGVSGFQSHDGDLYTFALFGETYTVTCLSSDYTTHSSEYTLIPD